MMRVAVTRERRMGLDEIVPQMAEPCFVTRYRRLPSFRETSGHVSPSVLSVSPPRSTYVRRWRRHARHCPTCAGVFRYMGLPVD